MWSHCRALRSTWPGQLFLSILLVQWHETLCMYAFAWLGVVVAALPGPCLHVHVNKLLLILR